MAQTDSWRSTLRVILVPSAISLAVTGLRLVGELLGWSETWFSKTTAGITPSGVSWVVGITWLALPFGVYFALTLLRRGEGPAHLGRAVGCAVLGVALWYAFYKLLFPRLTVPFPRVLVVVWAAMALPAAVQFLGWPALARALLAYGLAARIPVAIVMLLAMAGDWGTHYDYAGAPAEIQMRSAPFWSRYLWLAFFPQIVFWVGFTILAGSAAGSLAALLARGLRRASPPAP